MSKSDEEFRGLDNSGQRVFMKQYEEESELKEFDSNYDFKTNILRSSNQHFVEISSILS